MFEDSYKTKVQATLKGHIFTLVPANGDPKCKSVLNLIGWKVLVLLVANHLLQKVLVDANNQPSCCPHHFVA
jgi:hypothetical protein